MKRTKRVKPTQKTTKVKGTKVIEDIKYTRAQLDEIMLRKPKWDIFSREYCTNAWNKTQAYRTAYDPNGIKGLSDNTCASKGWHLVRKDKVQQYIAYLKGDLEELTGVSKERNLKELAKIAYSGIVHLNDSWVDLKEYNELTKDQLAAIKETKCKTYYTQAGTEVTEVHIVLHAKQPAIEAINKMMGYNAQESIKVDQTTTTKIDITKYTDEEKALMLKMSRKNEYQ